MGYQVNFNKFNEVRNLAFSIGVSIDDLKNVIEDTGIHDSDKLRELFGSNRISLINRHESRHGVLRKYRVATAFGRKPIQLIPVIFELVSA